LLLIHAKSNKLLITETKTTSAKTNTKTAKFQSQAVLSLRPRSQGQHLCWQPINKLKASTNAFVLSKIHTYSKRTWANCSYCRQLNAAASKQLATLPPEPPSRRVEPIESISSMNMIDGACSLSQIQNHTHNSGLNLYQSYSLVWSWPPSNATHSYKCRTHSIQKCKKNLAKV